MLVVSCAFSGDSIFSSSPSMLYVGVAYRRSSAQSRWYCTGPDKNIPMDTFVLVRGIGTDSEEMCGHKQKDRQVRARCRAIVGR